MVGLVLWLQYRLDTLHREESGAAAAEYGLLIGLIAVAIIAAVRLLGTQLDRLFDAVGSALSGVTT